MTQISQPWDGVALGDAVRAPYTETEWDDQFEGMFDSDANRGVLQARALALVGSIPPPANLFRIATGEALVKGKWYRTDANTTWTVDSSVGAWREDRIVLSCAWVAQNSVFRDPAIQAAQTIRLVRLINPVDGIAIPASTKTDGVLWEIDLYRIRVTNVGVVTAPNDDRQYITVGGVDATHNHEGGDGAPLGPGAIINRTRRFFVAAHTASAYGALGQGARLQDGATDSASGAMKVPEDYVSDMVVQTIIIPAANGNAELYFVANAGGCADFWNANVIEFNAASQPIAVTLNFRNCVMSTPLVGIAISDMINFLVIRDATLGTDTVNADA